MPTAMLARLEERLKALQDDMAELKERHHDFVTKAEFKPIQKAMYAAIGLIISGAAYGFGHVFVKLFTLLH